MTVDRSKFKGSTLATIKNEQETARENLPGFNASRAGFHTIEEGKNYRRIAPAHDPNDPPYRAISKVMLECEVNELDGNGDETGKKEVKMRNIFIATQHSSVLKKDPILLYIQYVTAYANEVIQDKDERAKYLYPINGYRGRDGKWNWGIRPMTEYVCYCWDEKGKLGREHLQSKLLDQMKKISVERADDNAEIVPDIFSDPDQGYPLIISKDKKEKGGHEFTASADLPKANIKESWDDFFLRTRITDEQLEDLLSKESLTALYKDVYTSRDFNMAVDGLMRFDVKNKYDVFKNDKFLEELEEIKLECPAFEPKSFLPDDPLNSFKPKEEAKTQTQAAPQATTQEKPKEVVTQNALPAPVPSMKKFLREYITENYGSDYTLPELAIADVIVWFQLAKDGMELPFEETPSGEAIHLAEEMADQVKEEPAAVNEAPKAVEESEVDPELQKQIDALRKRHVK